MPVNTIQFITRADKNCSFNLYGEREKFKELAPDDNFDVKDIEGILNWSADITTSQQGIYGIDLSGKIEQISFTLVIWGEDEDDERPMTIDTKEFKVVFEIEFTEYRQLVPSSVDIDLRTKIITVS